MSNMTKIAILISLGVILAGCTTTPEVVEEEVVDGPEMSVGEAYRAAAGYVPADAQIAYVSVHEGLGWEVLGDDLLPLANPDAEPGEVGTVEGLREELREYSIRTYGVDLSGAEGAVVAGSMTGSIGGVIFGDFDEPQGLEEIEFEAGVAYEVETPAMSGELAVVEGQTAFMTPVDEGMAWHVDLSILEEVAAGGDQAAAADEELARHFDEVDGARYGLAIKVGEIMGVAGLAGAMPDVQTAVVAVVMSV